MAVDYSGFQIPVGSTTYPTVYNNFVATLQTDISGVQDEIFDARGGQSTLVVRLDLMQSDIDGKYVEGTPLSVNLNMNGFRATGAQDAQNSQDYTTLAQVNSLIVAGGDPNDIDIMKLRQSKVRMYFYAQI